MKAVVEVQNLVYTCHVGVPLNPIDVAYRFQELGIGVDYNPKRFAGAVARRRFKLNACDSPNDRHRSRLLGKYKRRIEKRTRNRYGKSAILIFSPGKLVCTGAKTFEQAKLVVKEMITDLVGIGYSNANVDAPLQIQNMVGRIILSRRIHLKRLSEANPDFCSYDKVLFPGAIIRHPDTGSMTITAFKSGRMVITGCKAIDLANAAVNRLLPIIEPFMYDIDEKTPHISTKVEEEWELSLAKKIEQM